jgi:NADH-quinone oxidoreductase subunit J
MVDVLVFSVAAVVVLGGAIGVIVMSNPVHCALSLVASFFGVAVLFVDLDAHFLAAVQVIVYAGAIVVLFLFVLMLLGVDKVEDLSVEPLGGQRPAAIVAAVAVAGTVLASFFLTDDEAGQVVTGTHSVTGPLTGDLNVKLLGEKLFTDYLFAFEITSVLLIIAVVGAVVLARTPRATSEELAELAELDEAQARAEGVADVEAEPERQEVAE